MPEPIFRPRTCPGSKALISVNRLARIAGKDRSVIMRLLTQGKIKSAANLRDGKSPLFVTDTAEDVKDALAKEKAKQ